MRSPVLDLWKLFLETGCNVKIIDMPKCSDSLAVEYYLF